MSEVLCEECGYNRGVGGDALCLDCHQRDVERDCDCDRCLAAREEAEEYWANVARGRDDDA